ncbi:MAG: hypothetical protein F6K47_04825 [Symploca sp. SIO2E6]|nr:hypothetical protein [Symploca sp. SIO2E6]
MGIGNWELGIGNWELGIGNRQQRVRERKRYFDSLLITHYSLLILRGV